MVFAYKKATFLRRWAAALHRRDKIRNKNTQRTTRRATYIRYNRVEQLKQCNKGGQKKGDQEVD